MRKNTNFPSNQSPISTFGLPNNKKSGDRRSSNLNCIPKKEHSFEHRSSTFGRPKREHNDHMNGTSSQDDWWGGDDCDTDNGMGNNVFV